jgi:hypothetical protein
MIFGTESTEGRVNFVVDQQNRRKAQMPGSKLYLFLGVTDRTTNMISNNTLAGGVVAVAIFSKCRLFSTRNFSNNSSEIVFMP